MVACRPEEVVGVFFGERSRHEELGWSLLQVYECLEQGIGVHFPAHPVKLLRDGRQHLFLARRERTRDSRHRLGGNRGFLSEDVCTGGDQQAGQIHKGNTAVGIHEHSFPRRFLSRRRAFEVGGTLVKTLPSGATAIIA
jgi:hypothetical protein